MHTDCTKHDHPDGALLTSEGLPRCPWCRQDLGHKLGARPRRRRRRQAATPLPYLDHRALAAGEHLEL